MLDILKIDSAIEEILEKTLKGKRINEREAIALMKSRVNNLAAISIVADKVREKKVGKTVTFIVNRNINFTNICVGSCKFCAFGRRNNDGSEAYLLSIEDIVKKAKEAKNLGATEVCIQGGLNPTLDIDFYSSMLESIKKAIDIHIHAFSPMEVCYIAERSGLDVKETLMLLREKGLDSMPGTAAEILDDGVRQSICPEKLSTKDWVDTIKQAHKIGIPTTATMMYGHIEDAENQVIHLKILRDIQDETHGFTEFVPLSFVHFNSPLYLSGGVKKGATGIEDLRVHAVSRLFLDNFYNIQASWLKLGRKFAQLMLNSGANDLGGTLMEENISKAAGLHTEMVDAKELGRIILEAERIPRQRDTLYNLIES